MVTAKVDVPIAWKNLIETQFPEDLEGILSEKEDHTGNTDPKPHYDDCRVIEGTFPNGANFTLSLGSGQSNYFGGLTIYGASEGDVIHETILEDYNDLEVETDDGGDGETSYKLEINWV